MTSHDRIAIITPDQHRYRVTYGLGGQSCEVGRYDQAQAEQVATAGGRRVVYARPGERGWAAYQRDQREQLGRLHKVDVSWMQAGSLYAYTLTSAQTDVLFAWRDGPANTPERLGVYRDLRQLGMIRLSQHHDPIIDNTGAAQVPGCDPDQLNRWCPTRLGRIVIPAVVTGQVRRTILICAAALWRDRTHPLVPPCAATGTGRCVSCESATRRWTCLYDPDLNTGCDYCAGRTWAGDNPPHVRHATGVATT